MFAHRAAPRKRILYCPHCQSERVILEGALILGQLYRCLDCDYVGPLVLETDAPPDRTRSAD